MCQKYFLLKEFIISKNHPRKKKEFLWSVFFYSCCFYFDTWSLLCLELVKFLLCLWILFIFILEGSCINEPCLTHLCIIVLKVDPHWTYDVFNIICQFFLKTCNVPPQCKSACEEIQHVDKQWWSQGPSFLRVYSLMEGMLYKWITVIQGIQWADPSKRLKLL